MLRQEGGPGEQPLTEARYQGKRRYAKPADARKYDGLCGKVNRNGYKSAEYDAAKASRLVGKARDRTGPDLFLFTVCTIAVLGTIIVCAGLLALAGFVALQVIDWLGAHLSHTSLVFLSLLVAVWIVGGIGLYLTRDEA